MAKSDNHANVIPPQHNLFFGVFPDESTRSAIAAAARSLREQALHGRWVDPRRYHMTVHFLGRFGAIPPGFVEQAGAAAARVRAPSFDLELDTLGSFRNREVPVWLGCRVAPRPLEDLHRQVLEELRREGIAGHDATPLVAPRLEYVSLGRWPLIDNAC
jgi:RNA 2',3'-cyclic 3'-phosphodiesterase